MNWISKLICPRELNYIPILFKSSGYSILLWILQWFDEKRPKKVWWTTSDELLFFKFWIEMSSSEVFHQTFLSDFYQRIFIKPENVHRRIEFLDDHKSMHTEFSSYRRPLVCVLNCPRTKILRISLDSTNKYKFPLELSKGISYFGAFWTLLHHLFVDGHCCNNSKQLEYFNGLLFTHDNTCRYLDKIWRQR